MSIAVGARRTSLVVLYIVTFGFVACGGSSAPSKPSPVLHQSISVGGETARVPAFPATVAGEHSGAPGRPAAWLLPRRERRAGGYGLPFR
jgi:hypothetical protein